MKEFTPKERLGRNDGHGLSTDKSKMSELEFRVTIRILAGFEKSIESFFMDIKEIKFSHNKIKNAIT